MALATTTFGRSRRKGIVSHTKFWKKRALIGPPQIENPTCGPVNHHFFQHAQIANGVDPDSRLSTFKITRDEEKFLPNCEIHIAWKRQFFLWINLDRSLMQFTIQFWKFNKQSNY